MSFFDVTKNPFSYFIKIQQPLKTYRKHDFLVRSKFAICFQS